MKGSASNGQHQDGAAGFGMGPKPSKGSPFSPFTWQLQWGSRR